MAHSPFESWKRHAPGNRDEARAADLIKKLGDAETLSPQAMHRLAHHLRAPARRHLSLFSDVRLAAASVAALLLFVVGAWATVGFFDKQQPTETMLAAPRRPVQQMLAQNEARPSAPPEAVPSAASPEGPRLEEPELRLEPKADRHGLLAKEMAGDDEAGARGFAQPPPNWPSVASPRPSSALAKRAPLEQAEPKAELATRDRSAPAPAMDAVFRRAPGNGSPPAPATAAAPAETADGALAEKTSVTGLSVEGCKSTMPADSATLERNSGDVEQALFRHGVCLLLMSKREAGTADLRAYLARYPNGRYAEGVRALLVKNAAQTPPR